MAGTTYRVGGDPSPRSPLGLLRESRDLGFSELDLVEPPARFQADRPSGSPLRTGLDGDRVDRDLSPVEQLALLGRSELAGEESPMTVSRRALAKLFSWFLLAEDPQRRLDAREVSTLSHQISVVRHILTEPNLRSVMLADEVGLGKTVEAGLLIKELQESAPALRVLYLAPAGLVRNVHEELTRLGLPFRRWISGNEGDARLTDPLVVASIHRAVHPAHFEVFLQAPRWDLVILDECHHLSAWQVGGGKPTRKYRLAEALRQQLSATGRFLLMSGTPHQGHPERFENLLKLLRRGDAEERSALAGRVIYRTKEDIRDWEGRPLFPKRKVFPPLVVDLGADYKRWLERIHGVFERHRIGDEEEMGMARRRALDWRCGQALQWATSSIQAGLGFLVRQALRAGWALDHAPLTEAIAGLRPYRNGANDEPVKQLFERMRLEIGRTDDDSDGALDDQEAVADDESFSGEERWSPAPGALEAVLRDGLQLLRQSADAKWQRMKSEVLDRYDDEKVVLFAQPVETVMALAAYLEKIDGQRPAIIMGGQSLDERMAQVEAFRRVDGPRFLVSSKAGGEGLNLQVARVLVHVDVPWNPMDLEQRVGRVHRFLSTRTIQVHTIVVQDSREVDIYRVARDKLEDITQTMAPERFEELFARVMSLVPPEELAGVMVRNASAPLAQRDVEDLSRIVAAGYERWEAFHREFAGNQRGIHHVAAGQATWSDLVRFTTDHLGSFFIDGARVHRMIEAEDGEVVEDPTPTKSLFVGDQIYACGEHGGTTVLDVRGRRLRQLGLNVPAVVDALQRLGLTEAQAGAFHVRLDGWPESLERREGSMGLLFYARSTLSSENGTYREVGLELLAYAVSGTAAAVRIEGEVLGDLVRALFDAKVRRSDAGLPEALVAAMRRESERVEEVVRRPPDRNRRYVLFPLAAGVIEPWARSSSVES